MRWIKRPAPADLDQLAEVLGRKPQALAQAEGADEALLVACRTELCVRRDGVWTVWPWEQVGGGGWNSERGSFRWRTSDDARHEVEVAVANRFPDVFKERVEASTVVYTVIDVARGQVQIIARRGLGADDTLHWYAVPSGNADLTDPVTAEAVVAETERLKQVYL